jgi:hypothetical protein
MAAFLTASVGVSVARADDPVDTVLMTNGGRVRGTVMEEDPQKGTSIKLLDGTVKKLSPAEVKRVIYAGAPAAPAKPPPVAPTVVAPAMPVAPGMVAPMPAAMPGVLPAMDSQPYYGAGPYYGQVPRPQAHKGGKGLIITGLVLLSVGAASAAVGGALIADDSSDGETTGGIGACIAGGSLVLIGGILTLVGAAVRGSSSSDDALVLTPVVGSEASFRSFGLDRGGFRVAF